MIGVELYLGVELDQFVSIKEKIIVGIKKYKIFLY